MNATGTRSPELAPTRTTWRVLTLAQLREQPLRSLAITLAIALGVALASAVYFINGAALDEFDQAARRLVGTSDLIVRGSPSGFSESLYPALARHAGVADASPMLELQATLPVQHATLPIIALDPFRAANLQPALMVAIGGDITALFAHDAIVLSHSAAEQLHTASGGAIQIVVDDHLVTLRVIDVLAEAAYPDSVGIMDIGAAQWTLARLGRLNRVDLRLQPGINAGRLRHELAHDLPPGVVLVVPQIERGRAATATRAYRVNLNMLALVALLTGAFLVFSTQSLAVLRRRTALGLLRSLGVTRRELRSALLAEGIAIGAVGSVLGVLFGAASATLVLRYLGTDLGNRQLAGMGASIVWQPPAILGALSIGTLVAGLGAWIPALEAARRSPALALRSGDAEPVLSQLPTGLPAVALLAIGGILTGLPPVAGLPLPGYLAIAALLAGSILLVPALMRRVVGALPRSGRVTFDTAVAQLQGSAGIASISVAAIIVSFSLMVAMAIMVHSFRDSFDLWLAKLLPSDVQLRLSPGGETGVLSIEEQRRLQTVSGVARAEFRRVQPLWLSAEQEAVTLIARDIASGNAGDVLPLTQVAPTVSSTVPAVWISEALQDRYGYLPGQTLTLPIGGAARQVRVAGVWRDYVRAAGAIVMARSTYIDLTGDRSATEASFWRAPHADAATLEIALRAALGPALAGAAEIISTPQLRERSLRLFDRAFLITYALEAVAVVIGLLGVAVASTSTALARRAQFGMLRHIGFLRAQVLAMLASEGVITSTLAVVYGLALGTVLSLILVYVINRQSFSWSIDLAVPWRELAAMSAALILASAVTALWSGRAALSQQAIRAVREDW